MEILYVTIHLALISRGFCFNFGSVLKTLPPEFPEDFKNKILDMYSKHPEAFGETAGKGKSHDKTMKLRKAQHMPNALRLDEKVSEEPVTPQLTTAASSVSDFIPTQATMSTMQIPPVPVPIPIPVPMYPQMPIVLPMRTYFERVVHQHPPLDKIRQIIKEDEEKWEKYKNMKKENVPTKKPDSDTDSDSYDTDSDDSRRFDDWHYYEDFLHIKG